MEGYMTTKDAANLWHITQRQVQIHCKNDRIPGVTKIGKTYLIPIDAKRPLYGYYYEPDDNSDQGNEISPVLTSRAHVEQQVIE